MTSLYSGDKARLWQRLRCFSCYKQLRRSG